MAIDDDVFLLPVFQEMRRLGADLSLAEYLQAIQMLRAGVGLNDATTLAQACRLLWAKSRAEQELFDTAFREKAIPRLTLLAPLSESGNEPVDTAYDDDASFVEDEREADKLERDVQEPNLAMLPMEPPEASVGSAAFPPLPFASLPTKRVYHFIPQLPLSKNEMSGHWRQMRQMQHTAPTRELDIEATIRDICQHGLLREPVMRPRIDNTARLLLLIDQGGSMTPFKMLTEALLESVTRNSLAGKTAVYYFHDCPIHTLYEDSYLGEPVALEQVLAHHAHHSRVLIVSDAGAARAHYDDERLQNTTRFLTILRSYTYLYAWINPVPFARWHFTTAEDIEHLVPMFPLDRDGLDDALQILRGHPFPPEVSLHG